MKVLFLQLHSKTGTHCSDQLEMDSLTPSAVRAAYRASIALECLPEAPPEFEVCFWHRSGVGDWASVILRDLKSGNNVAGFIYTKFAGLEPTIGDDLQPDLRSNHEHSY